MSLLTIDFLYTNNLFLNNVYKYKDFLNILLINIKSMF